MPIRLQCPGCNAKLSVATRKAGMTILCPGCKTAIAVPALEEPAAAVAEVTAAARTLPVSAGPTYEQLWDADEAEDDEEEGLKLHRGGAEVEEMDLTPMVDVTFLLLIFFMITASFTVQKVLAFPPPDPDKEGASQQVQKLEDLKEQSVIVEIDENNQLIVDDAPIGGISKLYDVLLQKKRAEGKTELVIVRHYLSSHEFTVNAVDKGKDAEMSKIRITIKPGTKPSG